MYFFVKDNNMAKQGDFLKLVTEKGRADKFVDKLFKGYKEYVTNKVEKTLKDQTTRTIKDMSSRKDDDWVTMLLWSTLQASNGYSAFKNHTRNIMETDAGEFLGVFEDNSEISVDFDRTNSISKSDDIINIQMKLTPKGIDANIIGNALNVALVGGEFKLPDKEEVLVINASPNYADRMMEPAAQMMSDYFEKEFLEDKLVNKALIKELESELKAIKEKKEK